MIKRLCDICGGECFHSTEKAHNGKRYSITFQTGEVGKGGQITHADICTKCIKKMLNEATE